jgi:glycosyltransferase involved in cell wall biosynthesis
MRLRSLSGKTIEFLGNLTDEELCCYYQNCKGLIFPGEEDFGLTAVEAQACGKPVIAYGASGGAETIIPGKTGEIYHDQNVDTLIKTLTKFQKNIYLSSDCYKNSIPFAKADFKKKMKRVVENSWREWRKKA